MRSLLLAAAVVVGITLALATGGGVQAHNEGYFGAQCGYASWISGGYTYEFAWEDYPPDPVEPAFTLNFHWWTVWWNLNDWDHVGPYYCGWAV